MLYCIIFFFQAEDGIRDYKVTGVQTCALPIYLVTLALGGGFIPAETLVELRSSHAYANLSEADWQWVLDFVVRGRSEERRVGKSVGLGGGGGSSATTRKWTMRRDVLARYRYSE